jgi:hypothetical protein
MTKGLKLNYISSGSVQNQYNARFYWYKEKTEHPQTHFWTEWHEHANPIHFLSPFSLKATGNNKALEMESGMPVKNWSSTLWFRQLSDSDQL